MLPYNSSTTTTLLPSLILIVSLLCFTNHQTLTLAQVMSCDKGFSFSNTTLAKNITYCKKLRTLGAELGWSYYNNTPNFTLSIVFSAKPADTGGWIAWGLNPDSRPHMVNTRAIIAYFNHSNGRVMVNTAILDDNLKTGCRLEYTPLDVKVENISSYYSKDNENNGTITIAAAFSLPVSTYNASELNHVWQVGSRVNFEGVPLMHTMSLNNFDSRETMDAPTGNSPGYRRVKMLRDAHGILSVVGWGLFLPTGAVVVRYFREYPFQLDNTAKTLHVLCQLTGFIYGSIAFALGLSLINYKEPLMTFQRHRNMGITIFCIAAAQITALWLKPNTLDMYRSYWNLFHHSLGYTLLALIIVNILRGFKILQLSFQLKWTYLALIITIAFAAFVLEIITWFKFFLKKWTDGLATREYDEKDIMVQEFQEDNMAMNQNRIVVQEDHEGNTAMDR